MMGSKTAKLLNTPGPSGNCFSNAFNPNEKSPPCSNVPSARLIETARSTFAVAVSVADGPLRLGGTPIRPTSMSGMCSFSDSVVSLLPRLLKVCVHNAVATTCEVTPTPGVIASQLVTPTPPLPL